MKRARSDPQVRAILSQEKPSRIWEKGYAKISDSRPISAWGRVKSCSPRKKWPIVHRRCQKSQSSRATASPANSTQRHSCNSSSSNLTPSMWTSCSTKHSKLWCSQGPKWTRRVGSRWTSLLEIGVSSRPHRHLHKNCRNLRSRVTFLPSVVIRKVGVREKTS